MDGKLYGVSSEVLEQINTQMGKDMDEVASKEENIIKQENEDAKKEKAKSIGAEVGKSVLKGAIACGTNQLEFDY